MPLEKDMFGGAECPMEYQRRKMKMLWLDSGFAAAANLEKPLVDWVASWQMYCMWL